MKFRQQLYLFAASLGAVTAAQAGTFTADFNAGAVPNGTALFGGGGGGVITTTGGVNDSGVLKLTQTVAGQSAGFVIEDLDAGAPVNSFTATWKMRVGGSQGTPADGFSFSIASDLPDGTWQEEGAGTGLSVAFDIYDNTDGDPNNLPAGEAPAVDIKWGGQEIRHLVVPLAVLRTNAEFVDVTIKLDSDGTLDVTYNGQQLYSDYNIPGFQPIEGARIGWGARTGGAFENQFIDDISITTGTGARQPRVLQQPVATPVLAGSPAFMRVTVNDPENATVQWERAAPGSGTFTAVAGGTGALLDIPAVTAADDGAQYRAVVTLNGVSVTSDPATLSLATLAIPGAPLRSYHFNDGNVPADTVVLGDEVVVVGAGGVGGTGYLQLTDAQEAKAGTWVIPDPLAGTSLGSFFAAFRLNMTPPDGTVPADGIGFHVAPGLPVTGDPYPGVEDPRAAGLSIGFDVYNNLTNVYPVIRDNEAPSIEVYWNGAYVGGRKMPAETLNTNGEFADVRIRLEEDGTVDVAFNGVVVINNLEVPGLTFPDGADFAIGGRTGGAWQVQEIDDFTLSAASFGGAIKVVDQPDDTLIAAGYSAKFSAGTNDPARASYQWQRREPGGATFTNIAGATAAAYTTPVLAAADDQAAYRVHVTSSNGSSADSLPAVVNVVAVPVLAGEQVRYNFEGDITNTGTQAGVVANAYGTAVEMVTVTGGAGDSGVLHITDAEGNQTGTFVILDYNAAAAVGALTARFDVRSGGGTTDVPADGWSFSWGRNITDGPGGGGLEEGLGDDLRVVFDIYDNTDANPTNGTGEAPRIAIVWRGAVLATTLVPFDLLNTGDAFEGVLINVTPDGKVSVAHDGVLVHSSIQIPEFAGVSAANFALAGRTGGANTNQWFDNFSLTSQLSPVVAVTRQPLPLQTILNGKTVMLEVEVNDPARTAFQWQRQLPGEAAFSNIPGATEAVYVTPALTVEQAGVKYRAVAQGQANTVTSAEAVVNVVNTGLPATWETVITFNDGAIPEGSALFQGTGDPAPADDLEFPGIVRPDGGVNNSGHVQLTSAFNGVQGAFVLEDLDAGAGVTSMVTQFYLRIGDGTATPADGASFNWGPGIPDAAFGEEGAGTGLTVSFDIYNNSAATEPAEAPAIELRWQGTSLGNIRVPIEFLYFGSEPGFVPVIVRVNSNGTADLIFGETVLFWQQPLPGWTGSLADARFAWSARTGGLNAFHLLDEITITTETTPAGPPPPIAAVISGTELVITFEGGLQTSVGGVWTTIPGAVSPLRIPLNTLNAEPRRFWRAVR